MFDRPPGINILGVLNRRQARREKQSIFSKIMDAIQVDAVRTHRKDQTEKIIKIPKSPTKYVFKPEVVKSSPIRQNIKRDSIPKDCGNNRQKTVQKNLLFRQDATVGIKSLFDARPPGNLRRNREKPKSPEGRCRCGVIQSQKSHHEQKRLSPVDRVWKDDDLEVGSSPKFEEDRLSPKFNENFEGDYIARSLKSLKSLSPPQTPTTKKCCCDGKGENHQRQRRTCFYDPVNGRDSPSPYEDNNDLHLQDTCNSRRYLIDRRQETPVTSMLYRSRSLPQLSVHDSGVGSNEQVPGRPTSRLVADLRQLLTLKQHYYPEGGWGWVILIVGILVQILSHGIHGASGIILPQIAGRFGTRVEIQSGLSTAFTIFFMLITLFPFQSHDVMNIEFSSLFTVNMIIYLSLNM